MMLTIDDLRALKYCSRGSRELALRHGLNWGLFLQEGIDINLLRDIDDEMIKAAIAYVESKNVE
jgi:hypothetical protein